MASKTVATAFSAITSILLIILGALFIAICVLIEVQKKTNDSEYTTTDPDLRTYIIYCGVLAGLYILCGLLIVGVSKLFCCLSTGVRYAALVIILVVHGVLTFWAQISKDGIDNVIKKFTVTAHYQGYTEVVFDAYAHMKDHIVWIYVGLWVIFGALVLTFITSIIATARRQQRKKELEEEENNQTKRDEEYDIEHGSQIAPPSSERDDRMRRQSDQYDVPPPHPDDKVPHVEMAHKANKTKS
jgi:TRAP-type C4-dicarboxylate transport system permease small subunit